MARYLSTPRGRPKMPDRWWRDIAPRLKQRIADKRHSEHTRSTRTVAIDFENRLEVFKEQAAG